jgi:Flp pilus assembly protein TadG
MLGGINLSPKTSRQSGSPEELDPAKFETMPRAIRNAVPSSLRLAMRWRAWAARFAMEKSAVSAVEFAMIAPVLILLIVETLQIGIYYYTSAALNQATNYVARQIRIGSVAQQNMTQAQFLTLLCGNLSAAMSCPTNLVVNVYGVSEAIGTGQGFNSFLTSSQTAVAQPSPMTSNSFCPGGPSSYSSSTVVYVQTYYAMPLISPIWIAFATQNGQKWNGNWVHFVSASAAFKTEPYLGGTDTNASTAGC